LTSLELGRATDRKPPFKYSSLTRVGFSETDAQGIVYYGRYLPYFDQARVEYLRHLGLLHHSFEGNEFVMRANTIEYHAPARFDDLVEVFIRVSRIGRTSVTCEYAAYLVDADVLMVTARQTLVLVDLVERKACPVPDWFRERIAEFESADAET
jgi:acyl-CoA thioester hydrolase